MSTDPISPSRPRRAGGLPVLVAGHMRGMLHEPPGAPALAVLMCAPFGWEDMCSYRSRREWCLDLAARGHASLRFDLPGCGDSAGGPGDAALLAEWTRGVAEAGAWLRARTGAPRLGVVGIGLGGMLALLAAREGADFEDLVLWAVPSRGRSLVRELRAFARLQEAAVGEPPQGAGRDPGLSAGGYLLTTETLADLEALDLAAAPLPAAGPRARALVLGRDGIPPDERLADALRQAGRTVECDDGPGFGAMTREPQDAVPPSRVFERVGGWLAVGTQAARPAALAHDPRANADGVPDAQPLLLPAAGRRVSERVIAVEVPEGRLLGVLAEPQGEREALCAVLLNAGPQRRIGPNRMWVEIARRWAGRGVPSLRIDMEAIGDSDGDASALARVDSLYQDRYTDQVIAALDRLREEGLGERFLLLGLCAGAYWGLHTALADQRVSALAMLNPRAMVWEEWDYTRRHAGDLRERLFRAETWRRAARGDITLARHLETARSIAVRAAHAPARARRRLAQRGHVNAPLDPAEPLLDALRDRDQHALLVLTGREPLLEDFTACGLFDRLERWPNMRVVLTGSDADTHTLSPLWLQREVHGLLDEALERELARPPLR